MDNQSIQHTRWNCTYHIVFIPKYRRKIMYGQLKKRSVKKAKAFIIKKSKGAVSFKKVSGSKKITISSGEKITLKKGLKKGTYKLKVMVTASGDKTYREKSKKVTVKNTSEMKIIKG